MNKSIELTQSQIKAYQNRATMFMFPCEQVGFRQKFIARCHRCQKETLQHYMGEKEYICLECGHKDIKVLGHSDENFRTQYHYDFPLQKGDKNVLITEKEIVCKKCNKKQTWYALEDKISEQECPYCGYYNEVIADSFKEILDARVIRVQELTVYQKHKLYANSIEDYYNQQMKELGLERTYKDNDYVFLFEVKR